jgi:hypothetical protein
MINLFIDGSADSLSEYFVTTGSTSHAGYANAGLAGGWWLSLLFNDKSVI